MAAPNLIGATTINGKTTGVYLSSNTTTTVLNNPASSGKCLKVNTLNVSNNTANAVVVSVNWHNAANSSGSGLPIIGGVTVPGGSTLNVIDKSSQYYLEENTSLSANAATANNITVTCSYEDIS